MLREILIARIIDQFSPVEDIAGLIMNSFALTRPASSLWKLCSTALILLTSLFDAPLVHAAPGDDEYELGVLMYREQQRYQLAAETFAKFLEDHPEHPKAAFAKLYLGQSYVNLQQYSSARSTFEQFIKDHPEDKNLANAMYRVGESSYFLDDYPRAIKEFESYLKVNPEDDLREWALPYLADSYYRTNQHQKSLDRFQEALGEYPNGALAEDSLFGSARAWEQLGNSDEAITAYRKIANNTDSRRAPQAQLNIGLRYFDDGKYNEAIPELQAVPEKFPNSDYVAVARLNAGAALMRTGEFERAITQFDAVESTPQFKDQSRYWKALCLKATDDFAKASTILEELATVTPASPYRADSLYQLGEIQLEQDEVAAARNYFKQFVQSFPQDERAVNAATQVLETSIVAGDAKQARADFKSFRNVLEGGDELDLLEARLLILEGNQLQKAGTNADGEQAKLKYEKSQQLLTPLADALLTSDQQLPASFQLARVSQLLGQHEQTVRLATELKTNDAFLKATPEILLLDAVSQLQLKNNKEAAASANRFLELVQQGSQREQAWLTLMLAHLRQADWPKAEQGLSSLRAEFPNSEQLRPSVLQLAEATYDAGQFQLAEKYFQELLKTEQDSPYQPTALSGLGWSHYEQEEFDQAATAFKQLVDDHAAARVLASEASHLLGLSLRKGDGSLEQAAEAFKAGYTKFATPEDGMGGEVGRNAYYCAKEAARAFRDLNNVDAADEAYAAAFRELGLQPVSERQVLDKLLDEWAMLHYEAEDYARADELLRKLVVEFPNSDRADDAQLILAQSDFLADRAEEARERLESILASTTADDGVRRRSLLELVLIHSVAEEWDAVVKTANQYLSKYSEPDPLFPYAHYAAEIRYQLAEAQVELDEVQQAKTTLAEVRKELDVAQLSQVPIEQVPIWIPKVWLLSAEVGRREKEYAEVQQLVEEFESLFPNSPLLADAQVIQGRCLIAQAKIRDARDLFRKVLNKQEGARSDAAVQSQFYIGETYLMQNDKNYPEALSSFLKVYLLYKNFPKWRAAALYQAGQCDEVLGNIEKARQNYRALLKEFPESPQVPEAQKRLQILDPANAKQSSN